MIGYPRNLEFLENPNTHVFSFLEIDNDKISLVFQCEQRQLSAWHNLQGRSQTYG